MTLNTKKEIQKAFSQAFSTIEENVDLEFESKMIMYRFLSEIERISEDSNLNKKDLAKLVGTSPSFITQLFRGHRLISMNMLAKFQNKLNFTFRVEAISNNAEKLFPKDCSENVCDSTKHMKGLWTFHSFNPEYNNSDSSEFDVIKNPKRIGA